MDCIRKFLQEKGYSYNEDYYNKISLWKNIWKGKADWLNIRTIDNKVYPMYTMNMAKRSCEDLASTVTSEPFAVKAKKNDEILQKDLKSTKIIEKLPEGLEIMAYSGTIGTIARIVDAVIVGKEENRTLAKGSKTKIKTIDVGADQIIPLTIENGEIINVAFVSECTKKVEGKNLELIYVELHELEEKGYQITNKYYRKDNQQEVTFDNILETYNTLSSVPLFNINKLPRVNTDENSNNLGPSLFADAIDQLKLLDVTYNNFGMDFKLGQKILLYNKKLTRIEQEEYTDKEGNLKTRNKVVYPTDIQKQLFVQSGNGIMDNGEEKPYVYEYNPDLRVGDNKEGNQYALDVYSFKIGYGAKFYNFQDGKVYTNVASIQSSNKDFVDNMIKIRRRTNEYLKGICKSILLCEKMLGNASIDENQEIEIAEVDGFLQDDETIREKLFTDLGAGVISKKRYLMKVYNLTEEEAEEELERIRQEEEFEPIETTFEDEGE